MGLLGNQLQSSFSTTAKDTFNGTGSQTEFTLSKPSRTNDVEVFVENVQQEPTVAYSVSGTTLTFTAAPESGTGNIYVVHRTQAVQSLTVNTDDITDGAITAAKLAEGAVTDPTPAAVSGQVNTATDFFALPKGTTAQRPGSPAAGYVRHNTDDNVLETYDGASWLAVGQQTLPLAATGGIINTYTVNGLDYQSHTFTSSANFVVTNGGYADVLLVAGGGAGGNWHAGGGGAGGLISVTELEILAGTYSIEIGAGGAGGTTEVGTNGENTTGFTLTAIGGGRGGKYITNPPASGGSGGGGNGTTNTTYNQGADGTSGQGNDGGNGNGNHAGGGGGGAGAAGQNAADANNAGDGGIGLINTYRDGTDIYYAGGGGAGVWGGTGYGVGGSGGGGNGSYNNNSNAPTPGGANTGGGAGGAGSQGNVTSYAAQTTGGSGIVIVRYRV